MSQHPGIRYVRIRPVDEEINPLMTAHGELSGQSTLILHFIRWASTEAPFHKDSRFDRSRNRHEKQHHSASESCNAKEWLAERKVLLAEKNLRNTAIV